MGHVYYSFNLFIPGFFLLIFICIICRGCNINIHDFICSNLVKYLFQLFKLLSTVTRLKDAPKTYNFTAAPSRTRNSRRDVAKQILKNPARRTIIKIFVRIKLCYINIGTANGTAKPEKSLLAIYPARRTMIEIFVLLF